MQNGPCWLRRNFRIQVIKKKKQAAKDRFCINGTHGSSENVLLKTPSKECVYKIFKGRGGQTRCIMGDVQMVNSHTSQYSLVPGPSLVTTKFKMAAIEITFHTHQCIK